MRSQSLAVSLFLMLNVDFLSRCLSHPLSLSLIASLSLSDSLSLSSHPCCLSYGSLSPSLFLSLTRCLSPSFSRSPPHSMALSHSFPLSLVVSLCSFVVSLSLVVSLTCCLSHTRRCLSHSLSLSLVVSLTRCHLPRQYSHGGGWSRTKLVPLSRDDNAISKRCVGGCAAPTTHIHKLTHSSTRLHHRLMRCHSTLAPIDITMPSAMAVVEAGRARSRILCGCARAPHPGGPPNR